MNTMIVIEFAKNVIQTVINVLEPRLAALRALVVSFWKIIIAPACALLIIMGFFPAILAKVIVRIISSSI